LTVVYSRLPINRTDATPQLASHAADHNALADAMNKLNTWCWFGMHNASTASGATIGFRDMDAPVGGYTGGQNGAGITITEPGAYVFEFNYCGLFTGLGANAYLTTTLHLNGVDRGQRIHTIDATWNAFTDRFAAWIDQPVTVMLLLTGEFWTSWAGDGRFNLAGPCMIRRLA
jgi:hypothetical protein